jgi:PilZ domain
VARIFNGNKMTEQRTWKRIRERLELQLPVRVRCRETVDLEWTEITRLTDVTPFGAGFTLKRPVEKGRLVHMTIPMPRQLRVFDHVEDQYRVWAVVRYIRPCTPVENKPASFEVGAAFIGKKPPRSYDEDPAKRYEVSAFTGQVTTVEEWVPVEMAASDNRTHTRHNIPVDMLLQTLNEKGEVDFSEQTVTENISQKGAAIYTSLSLPPGRFVRLSSEQYKICLYAAVRGSSMGAAGVPRIHVEFIDREWPL